MNKDLLRYVISLWLAMFVTQIILFSASLAIDPMADSYNRGEIRNYILFGTNAGNEVAGRYSNNSYIQENMPLSDLDSSLRQTDVDLGESLTTGKGGNASSVSISGYIIDKIDNLISYSKFLGLIDFFLRFSGSIHASAVLGDIVADGIGDDDKSSIVTYFAYLLPLLFQLLFIIFVIRFIFGRRMETGS